MSGYSRFSPKFENITQSFHFSIFLACNAPFSVGVFTNAHTAEIDATTNRGKFTHLGLVKGWVPQNPKTQKTDLRVFYQTKPEILLANPKKYNKAEAVEFKYSLWPN